MRHTSSAPEMIEVDFISKLDKFGMNDKEFQKYFSVTKNSIVANEDCVVELSLKDYKEDILIESKDHYTLPGIITIRINNEENIKQFTLPFDHQVKLIKSSDLEKEGKLVTLKYVPGEKIIEMFYYLKEVNVSLIIKLLDGQTKYINNPEILTMNLHEQMKGVDLVHFETIAQNMFRDTEDPTVPARLTGYKSFVIMGQKQLPFQTNWAVALAFENPRKAIKTGLISGQDAEETEFVKIVSDNYEESE